MSFTIMLIGSQLQNSLLCTLKSCIKLKDLAEASRIHSDISKRGLLGRNIYLANSLINLYGKCGALAKAQDLFDQLPSRNLVSWNALITGYAQHQPVKVFSCLQQIERSGLTPDAITFVCVLKACASIHATDKGKEVHEKIIKQGLFGKNVILDNALVDMYAKCGEFAKAQAVFDFIRVPDEVTWNSLITGYAQHKHGKEALHCYERMQLEGLSANRITCLAVLKACSILKEIKKGMEIHTKITSEDNNVADILIGSALVDMYAKCGTVAKAQEVFEKIPERNTVLWNSLISGYVQDNQGGRALWCLEKMEHEGLSPDSVTFVSALKACGSIGAANKGRQVHGDIVKEGLLGRDVLVLNAVVDMYAKCGAVAKAKELFNQFKVRNTASWNIMIAGYGQDGCGEEAIGYYRRMQCEGFLPTAVSFMGTLKASGTIRMISKGKEIHAQVAGIALLESDIRIGTALVDMYAMCGASLESQEIFDQLPARNEITWNVLIGGYAQHENVVEVFNCFKQMRCEGLSPDVVSWNALISGCAQNGCYVDALLYFELMKQEGFSPDGITYASILKICGNMGAIEKGKEVHKAVAREESLREDILVCNALVDMYSRCGEFARAVDAFHLLRFPNLASWTALIGGYVQNEHFEDALNIFEQMRHDDFSQSKSIFLSVLRACGSIGALDKGKEIHAEIIKEGLTMKDVFIGNALLDMYVKCGLPTIAQEIFYHIPARDVVSWSTLIVGYAQVGDVMVVFDLFRKMVLSGVMPDSVTLSALLNVCNHSGMLDEAQMCFEMLQTRYKMIPTLEHHTCMIDLFGRAGNFEKAVEMTKMMPKYDHLPMWISLLGASQRCGDIGLGRLAFEHAVQLDESHTAAYVCMCNMYAAVGLQRDVENM